MDSGDLESEPLTWGLGINGTKSSAKEIAARVAPLQFCPANSQPESTQHQDRALRVAAQVLTPGPLLSGIGAEWQVCAGGISFIFQNGAASSMCYSSAIAGGIKEQAGAASEVGALVPFGVKSKNEKIVPDVTNYRFLTTGKPGYSSGLADEFSLISNIADSPVRWKARNRRPLEPDLSGGLSARITVLSLGSGRFSDDSGSSQKPSAAAAVPQKPSSARLSIKRRGLCTRAPPK
ncbi:MAG: hypothetical protein C0469_03485 [Cyanobacteria bacterium DS2.3.42]|nr:hypothetical protein [Cyanobacteria bacterium DS2.3.42]